MSENVMGCGYTQYRFCDSDDGDTFALYSAFLNYRFPDGSLLHVRQRECWCPVCDCFVMGEDVPTLLGLEAELTRLLDPDENEQRMIAFIGRPIPELIEETRKRINWRRSRKTLPKCLRCGSADITFLPDSEEFTHPKTGQRIAVVGRGWANTAEWHAEFTTEGEGITSDG